MAVNGGIKGKVNKPSHGGNTVTTITASGDFAVQQGTTEVDVLTVAGGGGAGGDQGAGGGGAGGFREFTNQSVIANSTIPITVGAGGAAGGTGTPEDGSDGGSSVFGNPVNPITSAGGGGGGLGDSGGGGTGRDGGSGGGGGGRGDDAGGSGTPGQGNAGGKSKPESSPTNDRGGGGGGAGAAGGDGVNDPGKAGDGGIGSPSTVTGTATYYAGGGGGGSESTGGTAGGSGGAGGGGNGGNGAAGTAGTANTGGGGGASGAAPAAGGAGGSGVVIVKEKDKASGVWSMKNQYSSKIKGQWPDPNQYEITNSLRFNRGDSAYLSRTTAADGNKRTWTWSGWLKRSNVDSTSNGFFAIEIGGGGQLSFVLNNSGSNNELDVQENVSGVKWRKITNQLFRDLSAWYHIVLTFDSTQSTASERLKLYVNGSQVTSFSTDTNPDQNYDSIVTTASSPTNVGKYSNLYYGGYMSDIYLIDGQALHCGHFGEPDPDNPSIWRPKKYEGTFGVNGFKLEFKQTGTSANSSGIGADTSGNDHHFTPTNLSSLDITEDTPTNNFNTLNPLVPHHSIFADETEGNTGLSSSGVQLRGGYMGATIMPTSGKWYFEVKIVSITNSTDRTGIAIPRFDSVTGDDHIEGGDYAGLTVSTGSVGRVFVTEGSSTAETDNSDYAFSNDDIAIFAVDMDASTPRVYVGKNGTWFTTSAGSGGNPASDTGYFEVNLSTGGSGFSVGARHSAGSSAAQSYLYNFGNPAFSISSGNADANGYGNFEYAVPSGYYSICTKNLAEYG